jgi:hypothetical protein
MNKKPKPLRPDPTKANYKGNTGKNPVVKITKVTKPLKKATVKNPSAPSASSPRGGGVRVITKNETFMKKETARRTRNGTLPLTKTVTDSMKRSGNKSYKTSTGNKKLIEGTQVLNKKGYTPLKPGEKAAANTKGGKSSGVKPRKVVQAPKPKGRFGLMLGGGSGIFGTKNK